MPTAGRGPALARTAFRVGSGDHLLEFGDNISSGYAFATIELCNPFLHIEDLSAFIGGILPKRAQADP